jgi:Xaa-Pro aminopeptidase
MQLTDLQAGPATISPDVALASRDPSDAVFEERRERVARALNGGVLVLFAAPELLRNNDVHHDYRQDSDFYYLTGFDEPGAALVLSGADPASLTMFVQPKDKLRETWDG